MPGRPMLPIMRGRGAMPGADAVLTRIMARLDENGGDLRACAMEQRARLAQARAAISAMPPPPGGGARARRARASANAGRGDRLVGYACLWDTIHANRGRYEAFRPGCFATTLRTGQPVDFCSAHDRAVALAGTEDESLILEADAVGLRVTVLSHGAAPGAFRALADRVASGELGELSVAYRLRHAVTETFNGQRVHLIERADLLEVSAVQAGAAADTVLAIGGAGPFPSHAALVANRNAARAKGAGDRFAAALDGLRALAEAS